MRIDVYTDGSSRGNPGPGGYGIIMRAGGTDYEKSFSQGFRLTTNNRVSTGRTGAAGQGGGKAPQRRAAG